MATCYNCPFFNRIREGGKIYCEMAVIKPPDKQTLEEFTAERCASEDGYKNCEFYKALDKYYERIYAGGADNEQRAD